MKLETPPFPALSCWRCLPELLRGKPAFLREWIEGSGGFRWRMCLAVIVAGAGLFGAAVGWWRSEAQAVITAIKLPCILLLTALGNAVLNGLLAPLLGLNLNFRQSALAVLLSFTLAAMILGSLAPLVAFLAWNLPTVGSAPGSLRVAHGVVLLMTVLTVAFAGGVSNLRLFQLLQSASANRAVARRILLAWLSTNLLLGTQLTWIARPFFGDPRLPVQWLRTDAFAGNFFEATATAARRVFTP
ncbi:MAG: hypothetical protein RIS76_2558 [Verrucomicrobiota bacterium]|jgi:cytochrome c oxidase subunit IV